MEKLTIIMPFLNEKNLPNETIESIYETSDYNNVQIIAIDDNSDEKSKTIFKDFTNVKHIKNEQRIGVDGSRQLGVELANTDYCLIIDAHMKFKKDNWLEKMIDCIKREPNTLWCCTCLGLGYGITDINKYQGKYYGADMLMVDNRANPNRPARNIIEPVWRKKEDSIEYELPVVLGANYFFDKKWFNYIGGLKGLKMWGTSEPFMSIKSWLAGGMCKISTDIEIGHFFRSDAPYATKIWSLIYNKIFLCKTIFPDDFGNKLIELVPKDNNLQEAVKNIELNKNDILKDREYYQSIFKMSIYDYCKKFNILSP